MGEVSGAAATRFRRTLTSLITVQIRPLLSIWMKISSSRAYLWGTSATWRSIESKISVTGVDGILKRAPGIEVDRNGILVYVVRPVRDERLAPPHSALSCARDGQVADVPQRYAREEDIFIQIDSNGRICTVIREVSVRRKRVAAAPLTSPIRRVIPPLASETSRGR